MMETEELEKRLRQWSQKKIGGEPIDAVGLASRVRKLRSTHARRRQAIVASVVLLFAGMIFYWSTLRVGITPESVAVKHTSGSESVHSSGPAELAQVANDRMDRLYVEVEHARQQTELLVMELRIQQAIAKADFLIRESERRSLREEQASKWLTETFRDLAAADNQ